MDRLHKIRFIALVGASGSGKSSLLRAGIIPRLRARNWQIHIIKPGAHPLTALANSLTQDELDRSATATVRDALANNPSTLHNVGDKLAARAAAERLLLAVDQFEELFTQCKDAQEQTAFVDNLVSAAAAQGATTILLSLRADFYGRVSDYTARTDLVAQQQEYIKSMAQEDLVRVIAEPARRGGWQFAEGLVESSGTICPCSTSARVISSTKNGLPSARLIMRCSSSSGSGPPARARAISRDSSGVSGRSQTCVWALLHVPRGLVLGAMRDQHHHPEAVHARDQALEHLARGLVEPMQVLEDPDHGVARDQAADQALEGLDRALAQTFGRQLFAREPSAAGTSAGRWRPDPGPGASPSCAIFSQAQSCVSPGASWK